MERKCLHAQGDTNSRGHKTDMSNEVLGHMCHGKHSQSERSTWAKNRFGKKLNRKQETEKMNARTHQGLHDTIVSSATSTCGRCAESDSDRRKHETSSDGLACRTQRGVGSFSLFLMANFVSMQRVYLLRPTSPKTWKPESLSTSVFAKTPLPWCEANVPQYRQHYPFLEV